MGAKSCRVTEGPGKYSLAQGTVAKIRFNFTLIVHEPFPAFFCQGNAVTPGLHVAGIEGLSEPRLFPLDSYNNNYRFVHLQ